MRKNIYQIVLFTTLSISLFSCSQIKKHVYYDPINKTQHYSIEELDKLTQSDNRWWNIISFEAQNNGLHKTLSSYAPKLKNQIEQDSKDPYLLMFWGKSRLVENGHDIVSPIIIKDLEKKFSLPSNDHFSHAGVLHAYGYLFSTLKTQYGHKRDRWISPSINNGFNFKENEISHNPFKGSLLKNLTYFSGMVAFDNEGKEELQLLENIPSDLKKLNYSLLKTNILIDENKLYRLKTVLVEMPKPQDDLTHLLIYTFYDKQIGKEKLITTYPISNETYQKYLNIKSGTEETILLPNNIYIDSSTVKIKVKRSFK